MIDFVGFSKSTEKITHIDIFFDFSGLFFNNRLSSNGGLRSSSGGSGSRTGIFDFLELVTNFNTDGSEVLEGVLDNVRNRGSGDVTSFQGDGSNL